MKKVTRKIYFDTMTGDVLINTGEHHGDVMSTTVEHDIATYTTLSERNRDTFDYIELEYGQYTQDFAASNGYRVKLETKTLEFSYPDPNEPEVEPVYQAPLSEVVAGLRFENETLSEYMLDVDFRLIMIELGL